MRNASARGRTSLNVGRAADLIDEMDANGGLKSPALFHGVSLGDVEVSGHVVSRLMV